MTTRATSERPRGPRRPVIRPRLLPWVGSRRGRVWIVTVRLQRAARELARQLPDEDMSAVASQPTDALALLAAMMRATARGTNAIDPRVLEAQVRGRAVKERLLHAEGGCGSAGEFASLLGVTRQAIDKQRLAGRLVAIRDRDGSAWLYPLWQLRDGSPLKGLESVLKVLAEMGHDGWAILLFFLETEVGAEEGSRTPLAALRAGDAEAALQAAKQYGEQGAL